MEKIVEKLLFLSKADRGEIEINRAEVDASSLLEYVYEQFRIPAKEKNIRLTLDTNEPALIKGDEILIRELLFNLLQNAITYTPGSGEIMLSLRREKEQILISVADTGCGIPEDEIPHIFERFYQVDKSRSSQGHGLGLSLCKWIVESHKGRITVESTVGKGSRFTVYLPATD
jgi:signal transduction histidine kinase